MTHRRATVAALYVDRRGPYFRMPEVDPWDITRDARRYAGTMPVVAHPPCGPWGRLAHFYSGSEHDCAPSAVAAVRRWGGILEHPADSTLWRFCELPYPDQVGDQVGGFTLVVDQVAWGHVARKRTWLYMVRIARAEAMAGIRTGGVPTHLIDRPRSRSSGLRIASKSARRRTPPALARWLVDLATATGWVMP